MENHGPPETITLGVETLLLRVKDVSFAMPKRTKLHLEIMKVGATPYIRGIIPTSGAKSVEDLAEFYSECNIQRSPYPISVSTLTSIRTRIQAARPREGAETVQLLPVAGSEEAPES